MGLGGISLEGIGVPDDSEHKDDKEKLFKAPEKSEDLEALDFDHNEAVNDRIEKAKQETNGIEVFDPISFEKELNSDEEEGLIPIGFGEELNPEEENSFAPIGFGEEMSDKQIAKADNEGQNENDVEAEIPDGQIAKKDDTPVETIGEQEKTVNSVGDITIESKKEKEKATKEYLSKLSSDSNEAIEAASEATSETERSKIIKETHYDKSKQHLDANRRRANESADAETEEENGEFDSVIDQYDQGRGIEGFYEDYGLLVTANEGDEEKKKAGEDEIKSKLIESLGEEKAKGIYDRLTAEDAKRDYEFAIRNKQLGTLAEIDERKGTKYYVEARRETTQDPKNATPIQTLHKLDEYLEEVAELENHQGLKELNRLSRATPMGRRVFEYGQKHKVEIEKLYKKIEASVNHKLDPRTQRDAIKIFKVYSADQGMIETSNQLLYGDITVLPDGRVKSNIYEEDVYLEYDGNAVRAYLMDSKQEKQFPIEATYPNAKGFDHAKMQKDCYEMGATLFEKSAELRSAVSDNIDDERYANENSSEFNNSKLAVLAGNSSDPIRLSAQDMNFLKEVGFVNSENKPTPIIPIFNQWVKEIAPNMQAMNGVQQDITKDDIRKLVYNWAHDENGNELSQPMYKFYSLDDLRNEDSDEDAEEDQEDKENKEE